jgi:hypothetical protein
MGPEMAPRRLDHNSLPDSTTPHCMEFEIARVTSYLTYPSTYFLISAKCGSCWVFGPVSALESQWLINLAKSNGAVGREDGRRSPPLTRLRRRQKEDVETDREPNHSG